MKKSFISLFTFLCIALPSFSQTLFITGDSMAAPKRTLQSGPARGWGMLFPEYVGNGLSVANYAINGASTKKYIDSGRWNESVISRLKEGDYVIIAFGHNDEKAYDPARFADVNGLFKDNLRKMISQVREKKAIPVLFTQICRRKFEDGKLVETHYQSDGADPTPYHQAVRDVAAETGTALVDLQALTEKWLNELGEEASKAYYNWVPEGKYPMCNIKARQDNTHLSIKGAETICGMIVNEMKGLFPNLKFNDETIPPRDDDYMYFDASEFDICGKISEETFSAYDRLPFRSRNVARKKIWHLFRQSSGIYVRFRTDAPSIRVRWTALFESSMNHQALTGTRGVDLYMLKDGSWIYAGTGRPRNKVTEAPIIDKFSKEMREYMLYLPLYDGISYMEFGVPQDCVIARPEVDSPKEGKAIVAYGTSITQGGCASRPGMNYLSILSRKLDREFVNLGFSGNGNLDLDVAQVIADSDNVGCVVFDYVGNASAEDIEERGEKFYRIIRNAHPDIPIIFLGERIYPNQVPDRTEPALANVALFKRLKELGENNIYSTPVFDERDEYRDCTVDGHHLTDYGFQAQADFLYPFFKKILGESEP